MVNITQQKRNRMLAFLEDLKKEHSDDALIKAFNEIENHLKEKKYGLVWEEHEEEVDIKLRENIPILIEDQERKLVKDKNFPYNFLIEGDNLQALYLLQKTHKNKIDCIYIDPPYNTGAKDWKYNNDYVDKNDMYRHSKWISFMDVRLRVARNLLKNDGALITTIDDNELANVYLLINEIFPDFKSVIITIQMNPGGTQGKAFSVTNEYAIVTYREKETTIFRKKHSGGETYNLRRWGSTSNRYEGATCFYPVIVDEELNVVGFGDVLDKDIHPDDQVVNQPNGTKYVYPIDASGIEKKWRYSRNTVEEILDRLTAVKKGERIEILVRRDTEPPKTVWINNEYNAESFGTKFIKGIIGEDKFTYPKSVYAVKDCLGMIVGGKPDAVVLDFFAGSGTTLNALNLINAEDGGKRKCIMVTNNEVSVEVVKSLSRKGILPDDEELENYGIARNVTWPRSVNTIIGKREDGTELGGEYITSLVEEKEKKRNIVQISYIKSSNLNLTQKKQFVSLIAKGQIPQHLAKRDSKYLISENQKHTASILFDDSHYEEWLREMEGKEYLTDFFVLTSNNALFSNIKNRIDGLLGSLVEEVTIKRQLKEGFDANIKYLKCTWTPRHPEDYRLSNILCSHVKEMIELQNAIEIDGEKNVLLLNKDDIKESLFVPDRFEKIQRIWLNQNIILNSEEIKLLNIKGFNYIPREFFGQELREAAE